MNRKSQITRFLSILTWPFHAFGLLFKELDLTSWTGFGAVVTGILMAAAEFWILTVTLGLLCYFVGLRPAMRVYDQKEPNFTDVFAVKILGNLIIGKLLYTGGLLFLTLLRLWK